MLEIWFCIIPGPGGLAVDFVQSLEIFDGISHGRHFSAFTSAHDVSAVGFGGSDANGQHGHHHQEDQSGQRTGAGKELLDAAGHFVSGECVVEEDEGYER